MTQRFSSTETCRYEYSYAYNQSEEVLADLAEAAAQTLGNEYPTILVSLLLRWVAVDPGIITNALPANAFQAFNDSVRSILVQNALTGLSGPEAQSTLDNHVSLYKGILPTRRLIIVAHSQGNIFANQAAFRLQTESPNLYRRFAIVPVASPESTIRRGFVGHVRFFDDLVILSVAAAKALAGLPAPLEVNDEDEADVDPLSHGFLEAYFLDDSSRSFVLSSIELTTRRLAEIDASPPDSDGDGIPDSADQCPTVAANTANGCPIVVPPLDTDGDGISDTLDACPTVAANTANGCPVIVPPLDTDGDGVPDASDSCPSQAANTANGCPPTQGTALIQETFETYVQGAFPTSGGWFIRTGATGAGAASQIVVGGIAYNDARSFRLVGATGLGINVQRLVTPPASHRYMLEAYVNTTSQTYKNAYVGFGSADDLRAGIRFMAGGTLADTSASPISGAYTPNTWTRLRVIVNPATNQYALYLGNTLVGSSLPIPGVIDRVWLAVDNSGLGGLTGTTAYFDDVLVTDCGVAVSGVDLCPTDVRPATVTFVASGVVNEIRNTYGTLALDFGTVPSVGESFSIRYVFDPATSDTDPQSSVGAFLGSVQEYSITVGGRPPVTFIASELSTFLSTNRIGINLAPTSIYQVSIGTARGTPLRVFSSVLTLVSAGAAPPGSTDALSLVPPSTVGLAFSSMNFNTGNSTGGVDSVISTVTSLVRIQ